MNGEVGPGIGLAIVLGAIGAAYVAVQLPNAYRITLAVALGVNLIVLGMRWPRTAALATLFFLPFLGLIRRLLILSVPWTGNDPLVLVGPVVAIFLFYRLYIMEQRNLSGDLMSKLVLGLVALGVVQVFNPFAHGSVLSNVGGLIFLAIPLLWFFIGRAVGDDKSVAFLMQAAVVVAVIVALYGLFQTEWSAGQQLPSWDQKWFDVAGYAALKVSSNADANNTIRAFSTFPSNGEYSNYLAIGIIIAFALAMHRRFWALLAVPLLLIATFYSGGRATMALAGLAIVFLLGMRTRNAALATIVVVVGVGSIFGIAAVVGPRLDEAAGVSDNAVTSRNIQGLLHPLDPGGSGVARWGNFLDGISVGLKNPAGSGTGATNEAGSHLSNDSQGTKETDNDISDAFTSLGAVGGVAYIVLIFLTFRTVFRRYAANESWMLYATMGVLIIMFGNWLNGGMYALSALTWFLIGWASGPPPEAAAEPEERGALGAEAAPAPA
jgi:hypothetical protein